MNSNLKIILVCALLVAHVCSSPYPQEELDFADFEEFETLGPIPSASTSTTQATTTTTTTTSTTTVRPRPPRPTLPRRPIITAIAQSIQNVNNAFTTTGSMVQALISFYTGVNFTQAAQMAQNAASTAGKMVSNVTKMMMDRLSTAAYNMGILRPFEVGTNGTTISPYAMTFDPIPVGNTNSESDRP